MDVDQTEPVKGEKATKTKATDEQNRKIQNFQAYKDINSRFGQLDKEELKDMCMMAYESVVKQHEDSGSPLPPDFKNPKKYTTKYEMWNWFNKNWDLCEPQIKFIGFESQE